MGSKWTAALTYICWSAVCSWIIVEATYPPNESESSYTAYTDDNHLSIKQPRPFAAHYTYPFGSPSAVLTRPSSGTNYPLANLPHHILLFPQPSP